jgi:hypothetical protein
MRVHHERPAKPGFHCRLTNIDSWVSGYGCQHQPGRNRILSAHSGRSGRTGTGVGDRIDVRPGGGAGVGLETDPRTDPRHHPTTQVSASIDLLRRAATDSSTGVSRWGGDAYGGR